MKVLKNISAWEWVMIAVTGMIVFGWTGVIKKFSETGADVAEGTVGKPTREKGARSWFRSLIQDILDDIPGGGIVNDIWDHIWP